MGGGNAPSSMAPYRSKSLTGKRKAREEVNVFSMRAAPCQRPTCPLKAAAIPSGTHPGIHFPLSPLCSRAHVLCYGRTQAGWRL